jgi:hypothetical protein
VGKPDSEVIDELYLSSLSRLPKAEEKQDLLRYLSNKRPQAIQDIAWAILNSKEFEFNH